MSLGQEFVLYMKADAWPARNSRWPNANLYWLSPIDIC